MAILKSRARFRMCRTVLIISVFLGLLCPSTAVSVVKPDQAHEVMAGFLYRFLSFTDWPEGAYPGEGEFVSLCILGEDPFGSLFAEVEGSDVGGRSLAVRRLAEGADIREMSGCQIMFISGSLKGRVSGLLESLTEVPVLTVSDMEGFARAGGMIEFFEQGARVRFVINKGIAERSGMSFRAKLLRVAAEVWD